MPASEAPAAVLFDRDGTLVEDVPYNADPDRVRPVSGARAALDRLRERGLRTGVLTVQAGVSRGLITTAALARVHWRMEELLGPFDVWQVCVHRPTDGCHCRAPKPGLVLAAARRLGLPPSRCVVVGDSGVDTAAGRAAGALSVLVPTPRTRSEDIAAAPRVATDLTATVDWVLGGGVLLASGQG